MQSIKIIFFGSTSDSVLVLQKLFTFHFSPASLREAGRALFTPRICAVVTQPPQPVGRKQMVTPTPVEIWAVAHTIPVLSFPSDPEKPWLYADQGTVIDALQPFTADLLISACYGQRIPIQAIQAARFGGLNVHPSLLPRWRGADPVPWAILSGDHQTGVTIVTLSKEFDEGRIIAQKKVPITDTDASNPLRTKLFTIGADLLIEVLPGFIAKPIHSPFSILHSPSSYARRLTREDGFEPWEAILKALGDPEEARRLDRKFRAFSPWPGLWTKIGIMNKELGITEERRLKILRLSLINYHLSLDQVQLEGKRPVSWAQFTAAYPVFPT